MGLFQGILDETASYDLDCGIDWVLQDYPQDFEAFWGLDVGVPPEGMETDDWIECKRLYELAATLADAARLLIRPSNLRDEQLTLPARLREEAAAKSEEIDVLLAPFREKLPQEMMWQIERALESQGPSDPRTKQNVFRAALQIQAARLFMDWPAGLASRMEVLLRYVMATPNHRVRAYLARVAECYIRNMRPEFAIMARAVLDAALTELYADSLVKEKLGKRSGRIGLEARIGTAYAIGHLDDALFDAAGRIKDSGDNAVHMAPGLESDPDELLADLRGVLMALDKHRG